MSTASTLVAIAKKLPATEEAIACKGTALESRSFKIAGKAFLFVGPKHALVKAGAKWRKIDLAATHACEDLVDLVGNSYRAYASASERKPAKRTRSARKKG